MEKTLRVLGSEDGSSGHSHSYSHSQVETSTVQASGVNLPASQNGLRPRIPEKSDAGSGSAEPAQPSNGPSKLSAYLNLFGDFVHNM
jgi:zinc transporter 7